MSAAWHFVNLIWTLMKEKDSKANANPWGATTIEWSDATSPPLGHGNFSKVPIVYNGPYEYSVPDSKKDFTPQNEPASEGVPVGRDHKGNKYFNWTLLLILGFLFRLHTFR